MEIMFVPIVLFMVIVAPTWIVMHYASKSKTAKTMAPTQKEDMSRLWELATKFEDRLDSLEAILDAPKTDRRNRP